MDIRQLRYFIALSELRHFGHAAEKLHIAQPALSQQMRALEEELGVSLFDRSTRPIGLTAAGHVLLQEGRDALDMLTRAESLTRRAEEDAEPRLAIGITGTAVMEFAVPVLRAFGRRFPKVHLSLQEMSSPAQLAALESGEIQIAFVRPPVKDERMGLRLVDRDKFVVALPSDHPRASEESISLDTMGDTPLVIFESREAPGFRELMLQVCRAGGYKPPFIQDAPQMSTMLCLVGSGHGIALVPSSAKRFNIDGVVFRPLSTACPEIELYAAWMLNNKSPYLGAMLDAIKEARDIS